MTAYFVGQSLHFMMQVVQNHNTGMGTTEKFYLKVCKLMVIYNHIFLLALLFISHVFEAM